MMNILDNIIADKKIEVAERKRSVTQADLERLIAQKAKPPRFAKALGSGGIHLIAEVKKASPSAGLIRPDFDPVAIARAYESAGASCVSVLTDEKYFQGKLADLDSVRSAVSLPVLRKDFIIDAYQLYETKAHGADAALLIVAALGSYVLKRFLDLCATLFLDALVEVHDAQELDVALAAGARVVGINARDLRDFSVDPRLAEKLTPRIPRDVLVVCESGIKSVEDLVPIKKLPVHGVLVGEALMRSGDLVAQTSAFVASLRSS